MKKMLLLAALVPALFSAYAQNPLINKPIPLLPAKTLDGKTIDGQYYKGHLTVVSFMYIGCPPCMNEIGILNRLNEEYKAKNVQFLCVARQMPEQMMQFNEDSSSLFGKLRKALGVPRMNYSIQPACASVESKMVKSGSDSDQHITLTSECNTITDLYGVSSFPTAFFVDGQGIIRKINRGGPPSQHDEAFYEEMKASIDSMLVE
ncbi:MAG: TlpA family protein disulfide reductase [Taibaiella sp.]|nr:TlpA family protein disulfide reductase [Taibaiella sp.]